MIEIPFALRRGTHDPATFVYTATEINGLIGMDEDGLALQFREKTQAYAISSSEPKESEVRVVHIPLGALRRVELRSGWFRIRLVLFAADLRAFEPFQSWLKGTELTLAIPRAERAAAADLVSSIELALSNRLLYPGR
jgi:hypothetical protein